MSNGFAKFISGKGFYLALALCLAGAGAAAWVAVDKTIDNIESAPLSETPQAETMHPEDQLDTHPAEQKIDNILQQTPESSDSVTAEANGDSSPSSQGQQEGILTAETPDDESSTDVLSPSVPSESVPESTESSEASTQPVQQQESDDFSLTSAELQSLLLAGTCWSKTKHLATGAPTTELTSVLNSARQSLHPVMVLSQTSAPTRFGAMLWK